MGKPKSRADIRKGGYRPNKRLKPLSRYSHTASEATEELRAKMVQFDGVTAESLSAARLQISKELSERAESKRKRRKRAKKTPPMVRGMFKGLRIENIII